MEHYLRRFPDFVDYDANTKIGRVVFYTFASIYMSNEQFQERVAECAAHIRRNLHRWERVGMGLRGLILDFRQHHGGSFYPVLFGFAHYLAGIPLFAWDDQWITLKEVTPHSKNKIIDYSKYKNVRLPKGQQKEQRNGHNGDIPIALVLGKETSSSGEIAAAMFQGKPRVKSFGQPTSGDMSVNNSLPLRGTSYTLVLTEQTLTLSNGTTGERIVPDIKVPGSSVVQKAQNWLMRSL